MSSADDDGDAHTVASEEEEEEEDEDDLVVDVDALHERVARLERQLQDQIRDRQSLEEKAARVRSGLADKQLELNQLHIAMEAAQLRSRALQGEDVRYREKHVDLDFQQAAQRIPLEEAIQMTMDKLDQLRSAAAAASTTAAAAAAAAQEDAFGIISVVFNADTSQFGITPSTTTFAALCAECVRHWNLQGGGECELKSVDTNETFAPHALVCKVLGAEVRLHVIIRNEVAAAPSSSRIVTFATASASAPEAIVSTGGGGRPPASSALSSASTTRVETPTTTSSRRRLDVIRKLQTLAWEAEVRQESVFEDDGDGAMGLRWLVMWAFVLALYVSSMVYRFNTASAFSASLAVRQSLGWTDFNSTSTSTTTVDFYQLSHASQLSDWMQQVALPYLIGDDEMTTTTTTLIGSRIVFSIGGDTTCRFNLSSSACPAGSTPSSFDYMPGSTGIVCETRDLLFALPLLALESAVYQFNVLSANLGAVLRIACTAQIDLVPITSIHVDVLPLSVFASYSHTSMKPLLIVSDMLLVLFACALAFHRRRRQQQPCSSFWSLISFALAICAVVQLCLAIDYDVSIAPAVQTSSSSKTTYQDLGFLRERFYAYLSVCCASLFLLVWLAGRMGMLLLVDDDGGGGSASLVVLFRVVHRALSKNFASVLFLFVWALASMSIWANLAFGPYVAEWTLLQSCVSRLAAVAFGAPVDFAALRSSQYSLVWLTFFFLVWFGLVVLVLIHLFLACVLDAYLEVHAASKASTKKKNKEAAAAEEAVVGSWRRWWLRLKW